MTGIIQDGRTTDDLIDFLAPFLAVLWKDWPIPMRVTALPGAQPNLFSLSGQCPHCPQQSTFLIVAGPHMSFYQIEGQNTAGLFNLVIRERLSAVMQCQACLGFILGIVTRP